MKIKMNGIFFACAVISLFFLGCENTFFQKIVDVEGGSGSFSSSSGNGSGSSNGLSAPVISYNKSTDILSWDAVSGANSYLVHYGTKNDTSAMSAPQMWNDTNFYPKKHGFHGFYISIKAYDYNKDIYSDFSNVVFIELPAPVITSYDSNSCELRWNAVDGATDYYIYCGDSPDTSSMELKSYHSSGTAYASVYSPDIGKYYAVKACNAHHGEFKAFSDFSNVVQIPSESTNFDIGSSMTSSSTLSAPVISVSYDSDTQANWLRWAPVDNAMNYYIYSGASSSTSSMAIVDSFLNATDYASFGVRLGLSDNLGLGKYYAVKASYTDNGTEIFSDFSNVVLAN